jgi:hypothetical protein
VEKVEKWKSKFGSTYFGGKDEVLLRADHQFAVHHPVSGLAGERTVEGKRARPVRLEFELIL